MDKAGCQSNRPYLFDYIEFLSSIKMLDSSVLRENYLEKGLTATQLGELYGVSKQAILARLRRVGVMRTKGRGRSSANYRYKNPPYGYKITKGRLVISKNELRVVSKILRTKDENELSWEAVARRLNDDGLRTRNGYLWSRAGIKRIYSRWRKEFDPA